MYKLRKKNTKQGQTAEHIFKRGDAMKIQHIVVIDGKEVDFEQLSEADHKRIENRLNAIALRRVCYEAETKEKTA